MKTFQLFKSTLFLSSFLIIRIHPICQGTIHLTLPPHSTIHTLRARGYWFVAPDSFVITGLKVPTEAGSGTQNIQVFKFNGPLAVYPSIDSNFTNLTYIKGAPNGAIQNVHIDIAVGDTIGVLGTAGLLTSYSGLVTPFTSSILGQPVILNRLLFQGGINSNPATNYSTDATGSMGRIELYYTCAKPSADDLIADQVSPCVFNFSLTNKKLADSYEWDFGDGTPEQPALQLPMLTLRVGVIL